MAKPIERTDKDPWQKVHAVTEVKTLLKQGETLSSNLRMTKYSPVGGRVKKPAVDWICEGKQKPMPSFRPQGGISLKMKLKSRMIVDHSGGVMENASMALHPHFGTPYIPGSAIKGIARHAAWCDWQDSDPDERAMYPEIIAELFGFPTGETSLDAELKKNGIKNRSGAFSFLPAHVEAEAVLEADLVNSHTGRKPIPVFFPAVAASTVFVFSIVPLRRKTETDRDTLTYFAEDWLKKGLQEHGAGAKTNAGYGWFEEV